ncbi:MAG TPA: SUF system Fe-S cluster assembly protein [Geminicoccaceae bacterium]|nr:SUF system Fe-S cluster assembly protein [Geminicoccaceae bacterium]
MSDDQSLEQAAGFLSADSADKTRQAEIDALGERVIDVLRTIYDPEIPVDIFELGLIYKVDIDDARHVQIEMTLTSPACPVAGSLPGEVESKVSAIEGVRSATVELVWDPPWNPSMMTEEAQLELGMI